MKIQEAFPRTIGLCNKEKIRSLFSSKIYVWISNLDGQANRLCENDPYFEFQPFLNNITRELKESDVLQLIEYFKRRWEWIRQTEHSYWYAFGSETTRFCLTLATEIAATAFTDLHPLQILMPTLNLYNEIDQIHLKDAEKDAELFIEKDFDNEKQYCHLTGRSHYFSNYTRSTSSEEIFQRIKLYIEYKYKLQLSQFVLSDDDKYPINVIDCLNSAEEDGILKHTNKMLDGKQVALSLTEKKRVESHSIQAANYYYYIKKYVDTKQLATSLGGAINTLIMQLRYGGENGGLDGTAFLTGKQVKLGTKNFYNFLQTLSSEQKQILFQCCLAKNDCYSISANFETCWLYLLLANTDVIADAIGLTACDEGSPNYANLKNTYSLEIEKLQKRFNECRESKIKTLCVELLASDLERILKVNEELLYKIIPQANALAKNICLKSQRDIIKANYDLLAKEILNPFPRRNNEHAYENAKTRLTNNVIPHAIRNLHQLVEVNNGITGHNRKAEYFYSNYIGKECLCKHIKTSEDLCFVLKETVLTGAQENLISTLGEDYLRFLVQTRDAFKDLIMNSSILTCSVIINKLGLEHINKIIISKEDYNFLVEDMALAKRNILTKKLSAPIENSSFSSIFFTNRKNSHSLESEVKDITRNKRQRLL